MEARNIILCAYTLQFLNMAHERRTEVLELAVDDGSDDEEAVIQPLDRDEDISDDEEYVLADAHLGENGDSDDDLASSEQQQASAPSASPQPESPQPVPPHTVSFSQNRLSQYRLSPAQWRCVSTSLRQCNNGGCHQ